jgi:hypothetical protein
LSIYQTLPSSVRLCTRGVCQSDWRCCQARVLRQSRLITAHTLAHTITFTSHTGRCITEQQYTRTITHSGTFTRFHTHKHDELTYVRIKQDNTHPCGSFMRLCIAVGGSQVCVCVLSHWVRTVMSEGSDLLALKFSPHWSLGLYLASVEEIER